VQVIAHIGEESGVERACAAAQRILELVVRPPAFVGTFEQHIAQNAFQAWHCHALTQPISAHVADRVCPHFEVIGLHKMLGNACAKLGINEIVKVVDPLNGVWILLCLDQTHDTFEGNLAWQIADVILERIG
jgi:hypothetical protein